MALTALGCPRVSHPGLLPGKMLAPASKSGEAQIFPRGLSKRLSLTPCTVLFSGVKMMLLGPPWVDSGKRTFLQRGQQEQRPVPGYPCPPHHLLG